MLAPTQSARWAADEESFHELLARLRLAVDALTGGFASPAPSITRNTRQPLDLPPAISPSRLGLLSGAYPHAQIVSTSAAAPLRRTQSITEAESAADVVRTPAAVADAALSFSELLDTPAQQTAATTAAASRNAVTSKCSCADGGCS